LKLDAYVTSMEVINLDASTQEIIEWLYSKNEKYELELVFLCPISNCKHSRPIRSDITTIKNHLLYDHDIQEIVDTAITDRIIKDKSEYTCHNCLIHCIVERCSFTVEEFESLNLQHY